MPSGAALELACSGGRLKYSSGARSLFAGIADHLHVSDLHAARFRSHHVLLLKTVGPSGSILEVPLLILARTWMVFRP